jgi:hypothetical protein
MKKKIQKKLKKNNYENLASDYGLLVRLMAEYEILEKEIIMVEKAICCVRKRIQIIEQKVLE